MTPQQQEQLIKELENRIHSIDIEDKMFISYGYKEFKRGRLKELEFALGLIKQTTVNRSSSEPKII